MKTKHVGEDSGTWQLGTWIGWLLAAGSLGTTAVPVSAQDSPGAGPVEEIVVTASRVVKTGFVAPTPVTVLGTEEIDDVAAIQITDVLTTLVPSFRTSGLTSTSSTFANLRGAGSQRTLVLLNGRRHVPTQDNGTVDLNVIPSALVERVEVVTGGASAAWGSDAVSGVVNLILKNDLQGIETEAQGGLSKYGDRENFMVSLAAGTGFGGGRGHVLFGGEYARDYGIEDMQTPHFSRPWAYQERGNVGNTQFATNGKPGIIYSYGVRRSDVAPGGLITNGPLRGTAFGAGGTPYQFGFGQLYGNVMIGGADNEGETNTPGGQLVFGYERYTLLSRVSYDLTDQVNAFFEGSYGSSISSGWTNPWRNNGTTAGTTTCTQTTLERGIGNIRVHISNAYLPAATRAAMTSAGISCFAMGRSYRDVPRLQSHDGSPFFYRTVAGLNGSFGENWDWDLYYQYGENEFEQRRIGNLDVAKMRLAVDAVTNSSSQIVCRSTLTSPTNGCVPFNLFGEGSPSAAAIAYVSGTSTLDSRTKQHVAAANLKGTPFATWAGPVGLAAGVEWRRESINAFVDPLSVIDGWSTGNRKGTSGSYTVRETYAEAVIPLAADQPWAKALELNVAGRYTDYSSSGGVMTWKAGLNYELNDQIRLRGTQSRDIRAGNLSELFTPVATVTAQMRDPRTSTSIPALSELRGNPTLKPEKADTTTFGVVLQPNWLEGLRLSADFYRISIDRAIGALSNQQILDLCFLDHVAEYCSFVELGSTNQITKVIRTQLNLDRYKNKGIDLEAAYTLDLENLFGGLRGTLGWRFVASHLLQSETTASIAGTSIDTAGEYTTPAWTLFNTLTYRLGDFTATMQNNYYSGGAIDNRYVLGQASASGINMDDVSDVVYTHLTFRYGLRPSPGVDAQVFLRVSNLFNRWPPFPSIGGGLFDPTGTAFMLGINVKYGK